MQARNVYYYLGGDLYDIAASYAYRIAEAQACIDGNNRTAIASAMVSIPPASTRWSFTSR